jgi:hypothetical protein
LEFVESNPDLGVFTIDEIRQLIITASRLRNRLKVIWMSCDECINKLNIIYVLPADISRSVSNFL